MWFQKISIPPPWRELEIPKGKGVKDPGNSEGEGGCMIDLLSRGPLIQYGFDCRSSCSKILSYLLSRTFTWKIVAWILLFDSHYNWNTFSFFKKHLGKLTNVKNVPLHGNGGHPCNGTFFAFVSFQRAFWRKKMYFKYNASQIQVFKPLLFVWNFYLVKKGFLNS